MPPTNEQRLMVAYYNSLKHGTGTPSSPPSAPNEVVETPEHPRNPTDARGQHRRARTPVGAASAGTPAGDAVDLPNIISVIQKKHPALYGRLILFSERMKQQVARFFGEGSLVGDLTAPLLASAFAITFYILRGDTLSDRQAAELQRLVADCLSTPDRRALWNDVVRKLSQVPGNILVPLVEETDPGVVKNIVSTILSSNVSEFRSLLSRYDDVGSRFLLPKTVTVNSFEFDIPETARNDMISLLDKLYDWTTDVTGASFTSYVSHGVDKIITFTKLEYLVWVVAAFVWLYFLIRRYVKIDGRRPDIISILNLAIEYITPAEVVEFGRRRLRKHTNTRKRSSRRKSLFGKRPKKKTVRRSKKRHA